MKGCTGSGDNWAKGHCAESAELIDSMLDVARKREECCEWLQGFKAVDPLGGGTGSGMGMLVSKVWKEYLGRTIHIFSASPSPEVYLFCVDFCVLPIHLLE